ncbi:2-dehydropantoate 2-reductase [Asanoa sp. NPDC049573]|uniref:ketopantoate reductase family protein n=1 Tax=Asanoa sp. NPDC049573 TaxID=3155396 RepID=UPI0034297CD0
MRWVIVGGGAVGGVVGGRLAASGHDVVLVARGAHLDAIRAGGLRLHSPEGRQTLRLPAVGAVTEHEWRPGDIAVLAVKGMDTPDVLRPLAAVAPPQTPVVCLQNGVANERAALRSFANVYGVHVMLPASHLAPGVVVAHSAPTPGGLDLGRYPGGLDDTAERLAAGLRAAGFASDARGDIMRWKHAKLLLNLGNAIQALCGPGADGIDKIDELLREEGTAVLRAAGIDVATPEEDAARRKGLLHIQPVEGTPRGGGSSWQSLERGTGTVEADYLNGEIVLQARLHGMEAPVNELARQLVNRAARAGARPGSLTPDEFMAMLSRF